MEANSLPLLVGSRVKYVIAPDGSIDYLYALTQFERFRNLPFVGTLAPHTYSG